jgi:hypothetical protein
MALAKNETTFEFDVTLDELLDAEGIEGLNDILDDRLASQGISHIPTDIGYTVVKHHPGGEENPSGLITIIATYIADDMGEEDEDDEEGS